MAVYFVLGGSGRGKSYFVNHTIVERAQAEKDKTFLMIVPEQATMQTQKEIVGISEQQGIMNIEVQSFVRLAYRIFGETGTANLPALDDMGKTLILHKVLLEQEKNLHYFGKNVHKKGYVAEIKSFLSEMMQYGIDEEGLEDMIQSAGSRMALKSKLEDMKVAYRSFRAYLKDNYITSEEVLTVLSGVVSQSVLLKDAVICLDGFTGFTPVQYQLIEELMRVCSDIYVTVTMDEAQEIFQPGEKHELFYLSKKTTAHFLHMIRENGIEEPEIIRVGKEIGKTRFHGSDQLQHLEQSLFRFPVKSFHKGDAEGTGDEREDISIHLLKQPQQEISFVVGCIKKLRREGYRYRDIAVVAGDMEVYGPLARDIFGQAQIPCFVDQKKTILANPLVNMLDALIDMIQYDFRYDTVIRYLRGKYSMLGMEETDLLDNYLLASGIRGAGRWKKEWDAVGIYRLRDEEQGRELSQKLNDIRQKVWNNIQEIYSRIKTRKHTVREFAEALVQFMEEQDFYGKLTEDVEVFRQMGDAGSAKEYDQIYGIVLDVLDRLVELLGEEKMSLKEFRELLDTGFSEARVGLIPPGVDQIVVGDLTRTRLDHVKHLFFLGATDANIPSGTGGGGILSASERSFLEQEDFEMAPTERQKIYTEQFYLYLTLTKPEEHLYLCLCEVGNDGKEQKPAYLIDRVRRLYPDISVHVEEQCQDAVRILGQDRGMTYLIKGLRDRSFEDSRWQQIYSYYKEHKPEELQKILEAAFYQPEKAKLVRENAKLLYGDTLYGSASRFELYASCAYRHFLQYGLRLEERQERTVEFYDIGNVIHETLELYTKDLILHNRKWQDVPSDERKQKAEEYFRQVAEQYKNGLLQDTARNHYLMKTMKRVLHRTIAAISSQMGQGNFETVSSELRFEQLHGPLRLQGSVDRVDQMSGEDAEYITIVDYKTGDKDVSLSDFYYGLQMQLVIYLQAAVDAAKEKTENWKKIIPAGIFYFHPQDPILESVDAKDKEKKLIKEFRMKGLLNESDPVVEGIGGDGVTSTKKCVAEKEFDYFMRYTQDTLEKMSEDILGGTIEVNPYRRENDKTPCEYCPYHGVCQFDPRLGNKYRSLIKLKDEQVYMELKEKYDKEETTE